MMMRKRQKERDIQKQKKCVKLKFMWPQNLSGYSTNHVFVYFQSLRERRQK